MPLETWSDFWCEQNPGVPCCVPNAWGQCSSECPRVHIEKAPATLIQKFRDTPPLLPTPPSDDWHS